MDMLTLNTYVEQDKFLVLANELSDLLAIFLYQNMNFLQMLLIETI